MYDYSIKESIINSESFGSEGKTKGGLYEALVADILIKNGRENIYFKKNEASTFEIEFLIENEDGVIPIEVKAGNSKSKSLDTVLKREDIAYGYKLINGNVGVDGKKISLPLYMAMFL